LGIPNGSYAPLGIPGIAFSLDCFRQNGYLQVGARFGNLNGCGQPTNTGTYDEDVCLYHVVVWMHRRLAARGTIEGKKSFSHRADLLR
jgi:hypothetical protein